MSEELCEQIARWLSRHGLGTYEVEPLRGDVSQRRYFRVRRRGNEKSLVVAHYPPELAAAQLRFARAAELLLAAGVRVPRIELDEASEGLTLLEDLGARTLYELGYDWTALRPELDDALGVASRIAGLSLEAVSALGSPALDARLLRQELEPTRRLFLAPRGLAEPSLWAALGELCDRLASEPLMPCHRDFMARNLIADSVGGVAVLDFQDLRLGPRSYDLASLLNDSLFASAELEEEVLSSRLSSDFERQQYRRAVVQRSLKAVGTFVRFATGGDSRHLPLVAPTLERARRHLLLLPETAAAYAPLSERFRVEVDGAPLC